MGRRCEHSIVRDNTDGLEGAGKGTRARKGQKRQGSGDFPLKPPEGSTALLTPGFWSRETCFELVPAEVQNDKSVLFYAMW